MEHNETQLNKNTIKHNETQSNFQTASKEQWAMIATRRISTLKDNGTQLNTNKHNVTYKEPPESEGR